MLHRIVHASWIRELCKRTDKQSSKNQETMVRKKEKVVELTRITDHLA